MKSRHLIAIFSFLAAFGLSVFFVGLTLPESCTAGISRIKNPSPADTETELQARIRKFLEADQQTGIDFANDMARFSNSTDRREAEKMATSNLVAKMKKIKCDKLPDEFCKAWDEHVVAWRYKEYGLNRAFTGKSTGFAADEQISITYRQMLLAALRYGVDFRH